MNSDQETDQPYLDAADPGGWANLEARARNRRLARCIEQASIQIDLGSFAEARESIADARALAPDAPEIAQLDQRLDSATGAATTPDVVAKPASAPPVLLLSTDVQAAGLRPRWSRVLGGTAVASTLLLLIGFGAQYVLHTGPVSEPLREAEVSPEPGDIPATRKEPIAPQPAPAPTPSQAASATSATPTKDSTEQAVIASPPVPRSDAGQPKPPSDRRNDGPAPATAAARTLPTPSAIEFQPPMQSEGRRDEPGRAARVSENASQRPADTVALAMTNGAIAPTGTAGPASPLARSVDAPAGGSRTTSAEDRRDESLRIRTVLLSYEGAYNRLDAKAAGAVLPGVDQAALGRASNGQQPHKISLGLCDITVSGDIGEASCAGKARSEPRAGAGLETVDRFWTFHLRKTADVWKIQEIGVR